MMKKIHWLIATLLLFSFVSQIAASEITLKNGDRITGKIVEQNDEIVVIETEYAGKIKIARTHIETLSDNAALAKTEKPTPATPSTANPEEPKPLIIAASEPPTLKRSPSRLTERIRQFAGGWEGNANIGFSYTSGNSNNITMSTGLRASKVSPTDGVTIYVRSLWNSNHGSQHTVTTQNAYWGGARYDRTLNRRIFGFVSYDFERDKPKHLSFRSVAGGGLGHRTIKNDRTEFELLLGAAWNRTWQAGGDTNTPEGLAGLTLKHKLTSRLRVQNTFTYFQNITDRAEYRFIFDATITADVTKKVGFYFALGNRFNNDPVGISKKNDFLFTTGLKWNFGKKK